MNEKAIEKYGPLAAARKTALLNQEDMAARLGVSLPKLVDIEKNPSNITLNNLGRYYQAVGADGKAILERYVNDFFVS